MRILVSEIEGCYNCFIVSVVHVKNPPCPTSSLLAGSPTGPALHAKNPSVNGMQFREKSIAKSLSLLSLADMEGMVAQAKFVEEAAVEEEVAVTWPLISAVLVAVVLQYLVGYNIGVMVG